MTPSEIFGVIFGAAPCAWATGLTRLAENARQTAAVSARSGRQRAARRLN